MSSSILRQRISHDASKSMYEVHINMGVVVPRQWSWLSTSRQTDIMAQIQNSTDGQLSYTLPCLNNLDQLYVQATCLHPVLIRKVRDWASKSRGLFSVSETNGQQQWISLVDADVEKINLIKWCKIKTVQRAVEKTVRSYGQVRTFVVCSRLSVSFCLTFS